jgi:hypothetical protein
MNSLLDDIYNAIADKPKFYNGFETPELEKRLSDFVDNTPALQEFTENWELLAIISEYQRLAFMTGFKAAKELLK